jgi:hypothetical protein
MDERGVEESIRFPVLQAIPLLSINLVVRIPVDVRLQ